VIVIPAIDLREGACVQLVGGRYDDERVRRPDPIAVARDFRERGFRRLHVVDLDAATGRGSNLDVVSALLAEPGLEIQVGGGVRDRAAVASLLAAGAARVVAGTRAVEDPEWLGAMAAEFPGRLIVAADVRERRVLVRGWEQATRLDVIDFARGLEPLAIAGLLVTAVHREGRMEGADLALVEDLSKATRHPLDVAGGVTTRADLDALARLGCRAAVIGMALYTGALDSTTLAREYA
jgi:phosphoribosylformimino-5-aminoimidazole carboxamide ribotide isomerase